MLSIGLTMVAICSIIVLRVSRNKKYFAKVVCTQSNIHQIVKHFIPKDLFELPEVVSQSKKHVLNNTIKVILVEDQAYWVHNNMFYTADLIEGFVDAETTKAVDTNNMSKRDIDKMLFILDSLKNGNSDDSSGAWNK
jgi:TATA-binding protein-associated factor Taf7